MAKLYPAAKPYRKGRLAVSDGYELYYEMCGNPRGKPVLFLHGGPGAGITPMDRRYFNPSKFNVILFDQRGAGRSRPFAGVKNNDTWKLVADIRALLKHLGIRKVFLFGGSWGSTLALVYAIKYPKTVSGMVLRGIFLGDDREIKDLFGGGVSKDIFPEAWERFISNVPKKHQRNPVRYYAKQMKAGKKVADFYANEWAVYELSMLKLNPPTEEKIKWVIRKGWCAALGRLESHYMQHKCFLPPNYIMKNIRKIWRIPLTIVHGRYDAICLPIIAYRLHKALPRSKLYFVISGHGAYDKAMQDKLIEEMDNIARR